MSSVVTTIVSCIVGLLQNKASCDPTLENSDSTDVKFEMIVVRLRDLHELNKKLGGLLRKDIFSSLSFLEEGVDFLYASLDNLNLEQKTVMELTQQDHGHGEASRVLSDVESGILSEDEKFQFAKEIFKRARIKATEAYCVESLNINDRILAAKLRVGSEILECLDSPQNAITGCLSFLRDLHSLQVIREMFSAYLSRTKSLFGNDNRIEVVKSVMMINYVLYQFNLKFSGRKLTDMFTWPGTIQLDNGRSFNPILDWREVATRKSMGDELSQLRDPFELLLYERAMPVLSAISMNNRKLVVEKK